MILSKFPFRGIRLFSDSLFLSPTTPWFSSSGARAQTTAMYWKKGIVTKNNTATFLSPTFFFLQLRHDFFRRRCSISQSHSSPKDGKHYIKKHYLLEFLFSKIKCVPSFQRSFLGHVYLQRCRPLIVENEGGAKGLPSLATIPFSFLPISLKVV